MTSQMRAESRSQRTTAHAIAAALIAVAAVLILGGLTGCGGDDDESGDTNADQAAIVVESPEPGTSVSSPVTISGSASVFEGTLQLRIFDAEGEVIARGFTTASVGAPGRGDFSEQVEFNIGETQDGVLRVFEENVASAAESPERELFTVEVPVRLEP